MLAKHSPALHIILLIVSAFIFLNDITTAYAQVRSCASLTNTVRSLERNRDYRSLSKNTQSAKKLQGELKKTESKFVRSGCQKLLNTKKKLTSQCRSLARSIIRGRSNLDKLNTKIRTGQAVARQRESILQQIASNSCSKPKTNSRVTFDSIQNQNRTLFDILFGNNQSIITDEIPNNFNTLRTLCVRSSDGYYWPISFSTTQEYLSYDAASCANQANGSDVELYYHKNPGEDADDMINMAGRPYKSMPNAFLYRTKFVQSDIFKTKKSSGFFEIVKNANNGLERTMIMFENQGFPMPIRDPRQTIKTTIAKAIFVPLPRNRPYREGEEKPKTIIATPTQVAPIKTFISNGKTIRIIGPDTLYALSGAADS